MEQTGDTLPQSNSLIHIETKLHLFQKSIQNGIFEADMVTALIGRLSGVPHLIKIRVKRT